MRIAQGCQQQVWYRQLATGIPVANPVRYLHGNAARYSGRYQASFDALLARMRDAGYWIVRCPGRAGGEWSATYRAYRLPADGGLPL